MKRILLLLALFVPASAFCAVTNYYVSNAIGSDSNSGTGCDSGISAPTCSPWKTINKARQVVAGACVAATGAIIVNIDGSVPDPTHPNNPRTYYQGVDLGSQLKWVGNSSTYPSTAGQGDNGCSAAKPVIYQGWNMTTMPNGNLSKPFISGGMRLTGWTQTGYTGGGAFTQWVTVCNSPCTVSEHLYYNGERRFRPRFGAATVQGTVNTSGTAVTWVSGTQFNTNQWNNAQINLPDPLTKVPTAYQIASVTDATHLTLKTSAGTQTGVFYNSYILSNYGTRQLVASSGDAICPLGGANCSFVRPADACSLGNAYGCSGGTNANCTLDTTECKDRLRYATGEDLSVIAPINLSGTTNCSANSNGNFDTEFILWESFTAVEFRICAIDLTNHIIIFSGSFLQTQQPSGTVSYGPNNREGWQLENFPDPGGNKITMPQQWFMDRTVSPPRIYYNAISGENPNTDVVDTGVIAQSAIIYGAGWLTFRNIQFGEDNWKVDDAGVISTDSQPRVPGALSVANSHDIHFEGVDVAHTSADGMEFYQCRSNAEDPTWCLFFISGARVENSYFRGGSLYDIGSSCIQIGNRLAKGDSYDTDTNIPIGIEVYDSLCDGSSRRVPGGGGLISGVFQYSQLHNNEIHDTYHSAVALCGSNCDRTNNLGLSNVTLALNLSYDINQGVVGDIGGYYFSTGSGTRKPVATCGTRNLILMNVLHDLSGSETRPEAQIGSGDDGIYPDNMTCNMEIAYNVVYRTGGACFRNTEGIPMPTDGIGGSGPNVWHDNICAYNRGGFQKSAAASMWRQTPDIATGTQTSSGTTVTRASGDNFSGTWSNNGTQITLNGSVFTVADVRSPTVLTVTSGAPGNGAFTINCSPGNRRLQFITRNNVVFADRDHNSSPAYYFQMGGVDTCLNTPLQTFQTSNNQYYMTGHTDLGSYSKAMHVSASDGGVPADSPSPPQNTSAQWCFYNLNNYKTGTNGKQDDGVTLCTTVATPPYMPSTGEETGSVGNVLPGFTSPGYPNDDYHLSSAAVTFDFTKTNYAIDHAGRITNKNFNPIVVRTFPTAYYDPAHTNNGDY